MFTALTIVCPFVTINRAMSDVFPAASLVAKQNVYSTRYLVNLAIFIQACAALHAEQSHQKLWCWELASPQTEELYSQWHNVTAVQRHGLTPS